MVDSRKLYGPYSNTFYSYPTIGVFFYTLILPGAESGNGGFWDDYSSGWWLTYPSEKSEFVSWTDYPIYETDNKIQSTKQSYIYIYIYTHIYIYIYLW